MKTHEVFAKRNSPWIPDPKSLPATCRQQYQRVELSPVMMSIARTTDDEISKMNNRDLIEMLEYSKVVSHWATYLRDVPHSGLAGLRLLAVLARRRCREEVNIVCQCRGFPIPRYAHR